MNSDYKSMPIVKELQNNISILFDGTQEQIERAEKRIVEILETEGEPVARYIIGRIQGKQARELLRRPLIIAIRSEKNEKLRVYCGHAMRDGDFEMAETALRTLFLTGTDRAMSTLLHGLINDPKVTHILKLRERLIEFINEMDARIQLNGTDAEKPAVTRLANLGFVVAMSMVSQEGIEFKREILRMRLGNRKYAGAVEALRRAELCARPAIERFLMSDLKLGMIYLFEAFTPSKNMDPILQCLRKIDHVHVVKKAVGVIPYQKNPYIKHMIADFIIELAELDEKNAIAAARAIFLARRGRTNLDAYKQIIAKIDPIRQMEATIVMIGSEKPDKIECGLEHLELLAEQNPPATRNAFEEILNGRTILGATHSQTIRQISETKGIAGRIAEEVVRRQEKELKEKYNGFMGGLKAIGRTVIAPFIKKRVSG